MLPPPEILRTRRHRAQIHAARAHPHTHKRHHHNRKRVSALDARPHGPTYRPRAIYQRSERIPDAEEDAGSEGQRAGVVSVAEIPEERYGEVHGQFCRCGYGVDLVLGVAEVAEEEGAVEGVGGDGAGAETAENGTREGGVLEDAAV